MKDQNWLHDMKLQQELAFRIFCMQHEDAANDKKSHSDALGEWSRGDDDIHVLTTYYREILKERKQKPSDVRLNDNHELDELAKAILGRFKSATAH